MVNSAYIVLTIDKATAKVVGWGIYSESSPTMNLKFTSAVLCKVSSFEDYDRNADFALKIAAQGYSTLLDPLITSESLWDVYEAKKEELRAAGETLY